MKTPLDRLIAEAKAEDTKPRVHDASWDAMEARLMTRVKNEPASFRAPRSGRFGRYARYTQLSVAALAVAAGTALVMKRPAPLENKPEVILPDLAVQSTEGAGDVRVAGQLVKPGQVLHAGDVIEAQGARVFLERPQKVTWLLDGAKPPESTGAARAQVKSMGDSLVLTLEDGAVEAQVNPVAYGEAFAIDIPTEHALVRVAVHGTHLRVARAGSLVTVDLTEGVVAIGNPPASGLTIGTTVTAPSHVEFDAAALDATIKVDHLTVRSAVPLKPSPVTARVVHNDAPPKANAPAPVAPRVASKEKPRAAEPASPPAPAPALAGALPPREAIASAVRQCAASRPRDERVRVSVSSSLRLKVGPSGDVQAAQFDPPLQPEIQTCAAAAIYKLKVTGAEDSSLTVSIDFTY